MFYLCASCADFFVNICPCLWIVSSPSPCMKYIVPVFFGVSLSLVFSDGGYFPRFTAALTTSSMRPGCAFSWRLRRQPASGCKSCIGKASV